jgi:hypothetical protein
VPSLAITAEEIAQAAWLDRVPDLLFLQKAEGSRINGAVAAARTVHRFLGGG